MLTDRDCDKPFENSTSLFDLFFNKNPSHVTDSVPIFISNETTITFGELSILFRKCAYNLHEKFGIQKDDIVAMRSGSQIECPLLLHGTLCAGATIALIKSSPEDDVETIIQDLDTVKPKLFIIDNDGSDQALEAATIAGIPKSHILSLGNSDIKGVRKVKDVLLSGELLAIPYVYSQYELENSTSYLLYTSGSTGQKKAVMVTMKSMINGIHNRYNSRKAHDRFLANKPFSFLSAVSNDLHQSILQGDEVYFSTATTVDEICKDVEKYRINKLLSSPHILTEMAKENITHRYDVSSLEILLSIGSALSKTTLRYIKERLGAVVQTSYGASELFNPFINSPELSEIGSVGRLNPKYTVRIVDENENDLGPGMPGELLVKGPTVTKGYYNNSKATLEAFTKDGFYRSGDIFICDKSGLYWFKSRITNMIRYHVYDVYPGDIEKVLVSHPKVADCGVVGIFSEELSTDLPRAYVSILDKNDDVDIDKLATEILDFTNSQLHGNKQIRGGLFIINKIPRNETGKIIYNELKEYSEKEHLIVNYAF